jgi:DNA-binding response OmpR family regulator
MNEYFSKISEAVSMLKNSKRVLVVEDDKDINELICYNLLRSGFLPFPVYDGCEAIKKLEHDVFDIVVLDLMLPGTDGFTVCRHIKEDIRANKTAVVIVSAREHALDKLYALALGADYYLTKPFEIKTLLSVLKELADSQDSGSKIRITQVLSIEKGGEGEVI